MAGDRSELTSRILPQITLCSRRDIPSSSQPEAGGPDNPAVDRFRITGNAIVSGGAGDLGFTTCNALLEHGLQGLAIFDIGSNDATARVDRLKKSFPPRSIVFIAVDVAKPDEVDKAVDEATRTLGPIHILANFAGVVSCVPALEMSVDEWRKTLDVNTTGGFVVARAVARSMASAKTGGSIIFIASCSAHTVNFPQPQSAYNTSKAAILMMKKCLAVEWAIHGIRVNSISPGYMDTILNEGSGLEEAKSIWLGRNPMGRMGNREELCGAVVLLASKAGSYITGADILVDGGQSLL